MSGSNRMWGLDLLRAFAIVFVLITHAESIISPVLPSWAQQVYSALCIDGVTLFFVLSGYLIGQIAHRTLSQAPSFSALKLFWIRRWLRTIPAYAVVLFCISFLSIVRHQLQLSDVLSHVFFVQNLFHAPSSFFPESWSLSVEEWSYLFFPALFWLLYRFNSRNAWLIWTLFLGVWIVSCTLLRAYGFNNQLQVIHLRQSVLFRADALVYGWFFAHLSLRYAPFFRQFKNPLALLGLLLFIIVRLDFMWSHATWLFAVWRPCTDGVAIALLLPWFTAISKYNGMGSQAVTTLSLYSYSLYLLHLTLVKDQFLPTIFASLSIPFPIKMMLMFASFWVISLSLAAGLYHLVERPWLRWRDRQFKN